MRTPLFLVAVSLGACAAGGPPSAPATPAQHASPSATHASPYHGIHILPAPPVGAEPVTDVLGGRAILSTDGYSRIWIGSKLSEIEEHYALETGQERHFDDSCRLYWSPYLPGVLVYVEHNVVARVSVQHVRLASSIWIPPAIQTDRGIGIGSTEAQVRAAYAPLEARPRSSPGADLYFWSNPSGRGLRFEFRGGLVEEISAGNMPALTLREGCL